MRGGGRGRQQRAGAPSRLGRPRRRARLRGAGAPPELVCLGAHQLHVDVLLQGRAQLLECLLVHVWEEQQAGASVEAVLGSTLCGKRDPSVARGRAEGARRWRTGTNVTRSDVLGARRRVVRLHAAANLRVLLENRDFEPRARKATCHDKTAHATANDDGSLTLHRATQCVRGGLEQRRLRETSCRQRAKGTGEAPSTACTAARSKRGAHIAAGRVGLRLRRRLHRRRGHDRLVVCSLGSHGHSARGPLAELQRPRA